MSGREAEKVKGLKLPGQAAIGQAGWFQAIYKRFDSANYVAAPDASLADRIPEGFKSMLLMRLAPLLPIPVDAHWYVAGTTPVRYWEFFAAHFIGTLKVAILDAYLGSLLLQAVTDSDALEESTKTLVIVETVGLILVSVIVTNVATSVFTQILAEEGVSMDDMMGIGRGAEAGSGEEVGGVSAGGTPASAADDIWLAANARERQALRADAEEGAAGPPGKAAGSPGKAPEADGGDVD